MMKGAMTRNKTSDAVDLNDSYDVEESVTSSAVFDSPPLANKRVPTTTDSKRLQVAAGPEANGEGAPRHPRPPPPTLLGPPVAEADLSALRDTSLETSVVDDVMLGVTTPPSPPEDTALKSSPEAAPSLPPADGGKAAPETPPRGMFMVPATITLPRNLGSSDDEGAGRRGGGAGSTMLPLMSPLKDVETGALIGGDEDGSRLRRRRRCLLIVAVVSLAVLAAVVGTLAYLLGSHHASPMMGNSTNPSVTEPDAGNSTDEPNSSAAEPDAGNSTDEVQQGDDRSDGSVSFAPMPSDTTPSPSPPPAAVTELYRVASLVTPLDVLEDASTPQGMAMQWLTESSGAYSYPSEDKMLQRYVVTVLEMALHPNNGPQSSGSSGSRSSNNTNDNSTKNVGPLPGYESKDECEWLGIDCSPWGNATTSNETDSSSGGNSTSASSSAPPGMVVSLNWSNRGIQGKIPTEIGLLTTLTALDLAENELEGRIPGTLWNLTDLRFLYLHQNKLSGPISTKISSLTKLVTFFAGENRLTGTIPMGLASPGKGAANGRPLRYLSLIGNKLTGRLPEDMYWYYMYYLDLGRNDFTGTFPASWVGQMRKVHHLYLDHNRLTGSLPLNFTLIGSGRLEQLLLSNNMLTGYLPANYPVVDFLQQLEVQRNNFTEIDRSVCELIVFEGGEMVNFRADCDICPCADFCQQGKCD